VGRASLFRLSNSTNSERLPHMVNDMEEDEGSVLSSEDFSNKFESNVYTNCN